MIKKSKYLNKTGVQEMKTTEIKLKIQKNFINFSVEEHTYGFLTVFELRREGLLYQIWLTPQQIGVVHRQITEIDFSGCDAEFDCIENAIHYFKGKINA